MKKFTTKVRHPLRIGSSRRKHLPMYEVSFHIQEALPTEPSCTLHFSAATHLYM